MFGKSPSFAVSKRSLSGVGSPKGDDDLGRSSSMPRSLSRMSTSFFGSKKGAAKDLEDDLPEHLRRHEKKEEAEGEEEDEGAAQDRRANFASQMEKAKQEKRRLSRQRDEDNTWSYLRRQPFSPEMIKKMQQTAEDAAMELISTLLSKAAFETLAELTGSAVANTKREDHEYALANDDDARERYKQDMKRRAAKKLKQRKTYSEDEEEEAKEAEKKLEEHLGGGGWLDITINSYSAHDGVEVQQTKRDELSSFIRTMGSLQVGIKSIAALEEWSMTANNEDLAVCRFYQDLHAFEEACKQADLHPELHRDRMAMVNIGTIVEQKTVTDVKDPREQLLLNDPNSNTEKSLVAASMAKIVKKTEKKDKGRGKAGSCRKSTVGGDSSMTPGGTVKRGRRFSIGGAKPMKTVYVLDPIKVDKMRQLAEHAHIKLGLYVAEFPPKAELVKLAEDLAREGFNTGKVFIFGTALLPLGSCSRLPRPPNAPPDTETTGRALPTLSGLSPIEPVRLRKAQKKLEDLTIDMVRKNILSQEHNNQPIEVCLVWMHRLLGGISSARDQRLAMFLLASPKVKMIEPTIATFGFKFLFLKLQGNETVRFMRLLSITSYLSRLSDADRGRILLFLLQLRVSAATQEAIACLFESSSPAQSEALMRHVGVRLLRFSVGGIYWRRCLSGLSNPYISTTAVTGLEPIEAITDDMVSRRALEVECLLRGKRGSKPLAYLQGHSHAPNLPYEKVATSLHSGDLLFIWRNEVGVDETAGEEREAQVGEALQSRHRKHQPQLAVVVGMEHMRPGHHLILTATVDPHALKHGVRRVALRSLLGLGRTKNLQRISVRRLYGSEDMVEEQEKALADRKKFIAAEEAKEELERRKAKEKEKADGGAAKGLGGLGLLGKGRKGGSLWSRYKVKPGEEAGRGEATPLLEDSEKSVPPCPGGPTTTAAWLPREAPQSTLPAHGPHDPTVARCSCVAGDRGGEHYE